MLYNTPRSLLEKRINEALGKCEENIVSDLIDLSLLKSNERDSSMLMYSEIYNLLGPEKFTALVSLLDGKQLKLPTKKSFKDTLMVALCYYFRNIEKKSWDEVKQILGCQDLNTIKIGIKIGKLEEQLAEMMQRAIDRGNYCNE